MSKKMITIGNETHTVAEWSAISEIPRQTITNRYKRGTDINRLLRWKEALK